MNAAHAVELSPLSDTNQVALINIVLIGAFLLGYYLFDRHK